jgi:hypothetical protein
MNNAEFINKVIYNEQVSNTFANLWNRWQDEKEYEDINEYAKVLHGAINKIDECMLFKATKKPFGVKVYRAGQLIHFFMKKKGSYLVMCAENK